MGKPAKVGAYAREDGKLAFTTNGSDLHWIAPEEMEQALRQGYRLASSDLGKKLQRSHSLAESFTAHIKGAANSYFGGAPNMIIGAAQPERLKQLESEHPISSTAGDIGGYLIPGGIFGRVGKGVTTAAKIGLGKSATMTARPTLSKALAGAAGGAAEGGAIGGSSAIATIMANRDSMSGDEMREHLISSIAKGTVLLAGTHLVGAGVSHTMGKVRSKLSDALTPKELKKLRELRGEAVGKFDNEMVRLEGELVEAARVRRALRADMDAMGLHPGEIAGVAKSASGRAASSAPNPMAAARGRMAKLKGPAHTPPEGRGLTLKQHKKARDNAVKDLQRQNDIWNKSELESMQRIEKLTAHAASLDAQMAQIEAELGKSMVGKVATTAFGIFAGTAAAMGAGSVAGKIIAGGYGTMAARSLSWRAWRFLQPKAEGMFKGNRMSRIKMPSAAMRDVRDAGIRGTINVITNKDFEELMENVSNDTLRLQNIEGISKPISAAIDAKRDEVKQFLFSVAPKAAMDRPGWKPDRKQRASFSRTLRAVGHGPEGVLHDVGEGRIDRESMDYLKFADPETAEWLTQVAKTLLSTGFATKEQVAVASIILGDFSMNQDGYHKTMRFQSLYQEETQKGASSQQMKFPQQAQTTMQAIEGRSAAS